MVAADSTSHIPPLSQQVFEFRFRPRAVFMDRRGYLAEHLSESLELPRWSLGEKRVEVSDNSEQTKAFVGHQNAGFTLKDHTSDEEFESKAENFLTSLAEIDYLGSQWFVRRMGVRLQSCHTFDGEFTDLRDRLNDRYCRLTDRAKELLDARLLDYASTLKLRDDFAEFQVKIGPMERGQIEGYFGGRNEYPSVGLYQDIDYRRKPNDTLSVGAVRSFLQRASEATWHRTSRTAAFIFEG